MNYSQYDAIAEKYDSIFLDKGSLSENAEVGEMLLPLAGKVLDIGCGTGLLTELVQIEPDKYLGIDPSEKMLSVFKKKHPSYSKSLLCAPYDGTIVDCNEYNHIVALFGAASYLSGMALLKLAHCNKHKFLMFYKEDYHPVTYEKCAVDFKHFTHSWESLASLFGEKNLKQYNNYIIVNSYEAKRNEV